MLQRHGWWALLAIALLTVVRGLVDLINGVTYQSAILLVTAPRFFSSQVVY